MIRLRFIVFLTHFVVLPCALAAPPTPTFSKEGVAFVQKHCISCHSAEKQKGKLNLEPFRDEASILKARATWEEALRKVDSSEMPPEEKPRPTPHEREAFLAAVRVVFDEADRKVPLDVGRVVARRLNRTEYNNTIRDLIGVDFQPAVDFPSDDIGYGFDNIGDVLTVSPVLMERYLAAAESIAQRAIQAGELPKPAIQRIESKDLEPKIPDQKIPYRTLAPHSGKPLERGPFWTNVQLDPREEYNVRMKVFTNSDTKPPPRIALLASGKKLRPPAVDPVVNQLAGDVDALRPFVVLKVVDVTARRDEDKQYIEVKIPPDTERLAVALLKPAAGQPAPTVFVKYFSVIGPLDTRPLFHRKIAAVSPTKPPRERTREAVTNLAFRAYRRPVAPDEVERLAKLVDDAVARGQSWEDGIRLALQAVLVSPKFLFRIELDPQPTVRGLRPLDEFALASRLSYFLWSSMPDDDLFRLAYQQKLTANLDAQVRRMLKDPKAQALVDNFALQWLQLRRLQTTAPDRELFPAFSNALRSAMLTETKLFFAEIVREDRSVLDLLDADFTYLNEVLAGLYGIADTRGNRQGENPPPEQRGKRIEGKDFVRVSLRGDDVRGGLLTQASVLTATSNPTRTSPVKRGRWVLEQVLGLPQPPPIPDAGELPEGEAVEATASLRQRMEKHRADPRCASCHARMDPIGFALENFNAIGAYRQKDGNFAVDASGALPDGTKFDGAAELKKVLKETKRDQFVRCLIEKMMIYALGRGLESYDRRTVERIQATLAKDGYRFSTLLVEIAKSEPFRLRRGKE